MSATLQERNTWIAALVESSTAAILGVDAVGCCSFTNDAALELLGYTDSFGRHSQPLGEIIRLGPPNSGSPPEGPPVSEVTSTGVSRHIELTTVHRENGTTFPAEIWLHPFRHRGTVIGTIVTIWDVTERVLKDEQIYQMQRLTGIGELTGGIAHDFNNLLTIIYGSLSLLRKKIEEGDQSVLESEGLEIIDDALSAAASGASLTAQLLSFTNKQHLDLESVNVRDILRSWTRMLKRTFPSSIEIRLRVELAAERHLLDRTQVESALLNLAVNARNAMPQGGTLTLTCDDVVVPGRRRKDRPELDSPPRAKASPGHYIRLQLTDTGSGMTPETVAHAHETFYTQSETVEGSGLGLSSVYALACQCNGSVTIDSEVGVGTTVSLLLPSVPATIDNEPSPGQERTKEEAGSQAQKHVLVIEDARRILKLTATHLETLGYRVAAKSDPREALDVLASDEFVDLVFTDISMPGLRGIQIAQWTREHRPKTRILLTTGFSEELAEGGAQAKSVADLPLLPKRYGKDALEQHLHDIFAAPPPPRKAP
jgi:signal transduction histidine kinase